LENLPQQIKLTYFAAIIVMLLLAGFILMVVWTYNKKQLLYQKEKQLRESEHQNTLLREEIKRQQAIREERERISHDMHDELGAGISALKLQVEFLQQKITDEQMREDIRELLITTESMNLSMREMLWSLNPENDNLKDFIRYICHYGEKFLYKTNIAFQCSHSGIDGTKNISSEIRRNLLLCVKEALNNIYKHSGATAARLQIQIVSSNLQIEISDNGKGLSPEAHSGNGLKNMERRMSNIAGTFRVIPSERGLHIRFSVRTDRP